MTWLKLTGKALYLMKGSSDRFIDSVNASKSFANENQLRVSLPLQWFSGTDVPGSLVVDLNGEEPLPIENNAPPSGDRSLAGLSIVLDPGHGEVEGGVNDPGAVNRKLARNERDEVRKQADFIKQALQSKGANVRIVENNTGKSLRQIGMEGDGADCFVSLHLNAFNGTAQGHEVLVDSGGSSSEEKLATMINAELDRELSIPNRGVKRQGLGVLRGVPVAVPAVLVESFFIDSVQDAASMEQLIATSAQAIATGIEKFLTS